MILYTMAAELDSLCHFPHCACLYRRCPRQMLGSLSSKIIETAIGGGGAPGAQEQDHVPRVVSIFRRIGGSIRARLSNRPAVLVREVVPSQVSILNTH